MFLASALRMFVISIALLIINAHASVFGATLNEVMQAAYKLDQSKFTPAIARSAVEAQSQMVRQIERLRETALKGANIYADLYFARRLKIIMESQFKFAQQQAQLEEQRLEQGLSTLTNLDLVKTYTFGVEKKLLTAQRKVEVYEREFLRHAGRPAPPKLARLDFAGQIKSHHSVQEGISLSHPELMRIAYQIKNIRSKYETEKPKKSDLRSLEKLKSRVLEQEISFDETLQEIQFEAEGIYLNHVSFRKQMLIEKRQILATRNLFNSMLESRKHDLNTTPEVLDVFDQAILARTELLQSEKQSTTMMINLLSIMGKLVPGEFVTRQKLVWYKKPIVEKFDKLAQIGR